MKKIYLTSEFNKVANKVYKDIGLKNPKTLFIYTAAEERYLKVDWFLKDKKALTKNGFEITEYSVTGKSQKEIENFISDFDVIYITGGDTFYLMEKTLESGFDKVLKKVLENKIFIGQSAGSVFLGNSVALKANPPKTNLKNFDGLKIVNFTIIPHWCREYAKERKRDLFDKMYDLGDNLILLKDDSYVFTDGKKFEIR